MPKAGDAYISLHGDFGPLNRELRSSQTSFGRNLGQMEQSSKRSFGRIGQATEGATRKQRDFRTSVASTGRSIARYAVASTGIYGTARAFGKVVSELEEANKAGKQTQAVLTSTGNAAGVTAAQVERLANRIALKSGMDDEAIQSAENLLLTFTDVKNEVGKGNDVFTQATKIITDMSVALGQDLNSSTIQVGKALQDPIKGITALRRVGVNFNAQQTEQVKKMVESGHAMQAQKFILRELNKEFAGSAAAQATGLDKLRARINDLAENVGRAFEPNIDKAIASFDRFVKEVDGIVSDPKLSQDEKISKVTDVIIDRITAAIPEIAGAVGQTAPKVALAFVKGFINANVWGKLALGAFLVSKTLGWGNIFRAAGGKVLASFGSTFLPGMTTAGAEGTLGASRSAMAAAPAFEAPGLAAGRAWSVGYRAGAIAVPPIPGAPVPGGPSKRKPPRGRGTSLPVPPVLPIPQLTKLGKIGRFLKVAGSNLTLPIAVVFTAGDAKDAVEKALPDSLKKSKKGGPGLIPSLLPHIPGPKDLEGHGGLLGALFGGKSGDDKGLAKRRDAFKAQAAAIRETTSGLVGLQQATERQRATLPAVQAAEQRVAQLRKEGKTGTHEYAVALRALDAAEGQRLRAVARSNALRSSTQQAAQRDVAAAQQALSAARKSGASAAEIATLSHRVAQARTREAAATLNVARAQKGLTPVTGKASQQLGLLAKQFKNIEGFGKFKKFLVTADVGQVTNAVKIVANLKELGKGRVAMKIFAESKTPEEALKRLRELVKQLESKRHRIQMELRDQATRRLEHLRTVIASLPEKKKLTFDADVKLTRKLTRLMDFAGQGQGAKQLKLTGPGHGAKGGTVGKSKNLPTSLAVVGEEGPELVKLPVGSRVFSHPESKRMAKEHGIPGFAKGGVVKSGLGGPFGSGSGFIPVTELARTFGLRPTAGRTNHSTQTTTGSTSDHSWGGAVDYSNGVLTPGEDRFAAFWKKHLEVIKQLIWRNKVQLGSSKGATVPGHEDHVHLALLRQFAMSAEKMQQVIGGTGDFNPAKRKALPRHLSLGQYVTLAKNAKFPDPALAAAIFYAESSGNIHAVGDGGKSFGPAQIYTPAHPNYDPDKLQKDARYNFKAAYDISKHGQDFTPWTMFKNKHYKKFLGGKATPLPSGGAAGGGSSMADYYALWLEEAAGASAKLKVLNRALKYWRGIYKRNRGRHPDRALTALEKIKDYRSQKKALRVKGPPAANFQLADLNYLHSAVAPDHRWNIGYFQKPLDRIDLDLAKASLTETYGADGNLVPSSLTDDISAASAKRDVWEQIYALTAGVDIKRQVPNNKGKLVNVLDHISGTPKQQVEAAGSLKDARDSLRSIQDEAKSEGVTADAGVSPKADLRNFATEIANLLRQYAGNFTQLPSFAKGGVLKKTLALVGEKGPEIAELPVGTRIHSNTESKQIIREMGLPAFAEGGVIRPASRDESVTSRLERIEVAIKQAQPSGQPIVHKTVNQDITIEEAKPDPHIFAKNTLYDLEAGI